jgi:hypothetical protein
MLSNLPEEIEHIYIYIYIERERERERERNVNKRELILSTKYIDI